MVFFKSQSLNLKISFQTEWSHLKVWTRWWAKSFSWRSTRTRDSTPSWTTSTNVTKKSAQAFNRGQTSISYYFCTFSHPSDWVKNRLAIHYPIFVDVQWNLIFRIHELESRLAKLSQAERAEDAKQKELIHGLKVDNVDLNLKVSELERELVLLHFLFFDTYHQ